MYYAVRVSLFGLPRAILVIVKSVLSGHSEIDKAKVVESIAECSGTFCNTFDLH